MAPSLVDIIVPVLLTSLIAMMAWIVKSLQDINASLAVVVHQVRDHGKRIERIEAL